MRRLILPLLAFALLPQCRERSDSEPVSAPSAVETAEPAKTKMDAEGAEKVFKAFVAKAPLNRDTGDFFHFVKVSCQGGACAGTLSKAEHEILLAAGDVPAQMQIDGAAAQQATAALSAAGANPARVNELCCLTDGIKFACSFQNDQPANTVAGNNAAASATNDGGGSSAENSAANTSTGSSTSSGGSTSTGAESLPKKKPIAGSCYCGPYNGYCMIFKFGDDVALGYKKQDVCQVQDCQQNFASIMINQCERIWRVWPVQ